MTKEEYINEWFKEAIRLIDPEAKGDPFEIRNEVYVMANMSWLRTRAEVSWSYYEKEQEELR